MNDKPTWTRNKQVQQQLWTVMFLLLGAVLLYASSQLMRPRAPEIKGPNLATIQAAGKLRVATVNSPLTYYFVREQPQGFEYELATAFAQSLGVELEVVVSDHYEQMFQYLQDGKADIAAANISKTPEREASVLFGPAYQEATQAVVYRRGERKPRSVDSLAGRELAVVAGSSYAEKLADLSQQYPDITWYESPGASIDDLFEQINQGELELTLADSNIFDVIQRFYPRVALGFHLEDSQKIAWAMPDSAGDDLQTAMAAFFARSETESLITRLSDKYFSHVDQYNQRNTHYFLRDIDQLLPNIEQMFRDSAQASQIDWKLLAAVAYQESRWDPDAVSPTGVRGMMMLTQATARELGVDRRNVEQSIQGGAAYLVQMKNKIPQRIAEPDRTWMALAAYNVGFGHLEDARVITQRRGLNPDRWVEVSQNLPLLTQKKWYAQTRYGYARGHEAVQYVDNIRSYYDILNWHYSQLNKALAAAD